MTTIRNRWLTALTITTVTLSAGCSSDSVAPENCLDETVDLECVVRLAGEWEARADNDERRRLAALLNQHPPLSVVAHPTLPALEQCRLANPGKLCVTRVAVDPLCSPIPTGLPDLVGIALRSPTARDFTTLAESDDGQEAATDIAVDRICDLIERSRDQVVRETEAERLGLSEVEVRTSSDQLDDQLAELIELDMSPSASLVWERAHRRLNELRSYGTATVTEPSTRLCVVKRAWRFFTVRCT